ncbi:MAG: hypothetical protein WBO46_15835 [Caldilineaceae bacterium]
MEPYRYSVGNAVNPKPGDPRFKSEQLAFAYAAEKSESDEMTVLAVWDSYNGDEIIRLYLHGWGYIG